MVPIVIEKSTRGDQAFDIYSRLLKDRIIILTGAITDEVSSSIVAQLLLLNQDNDPIKLYINSPGGSVSAGLAIYDTMQFIKPTVKTYCIGQAASMGALLLAGGEKDSRFILPNARVMIHQPHGGVEGRESDIRVQAKEIQRIREVTTEILKKHTNIASLDDKDLETDYWMDANSAVKLGFVDKIIKS